MAATGTPRISTPVTPASRSFSHAPTGSKTLSTGPPSQPDVPQLPAPATFDIVPHVHTLLSRLLIPAGTGAAATAADANKGGAGDASGTSTTTAADGGTGAGGGAGAQAGGSGAEAGGTGTGQSDGDKSSADPDAAPLDIQQLAAASSGLKVRLQKARSACAKLGDVERTVEEQEEEMRELEERVRRLREVLNDLGVGVGEGSRDIAVR